MNVADITREQLAALFDHTLLKAFSTDGDFEVLCREAIENGFHAVMVNPAQVRLCKKLLEGAPVRVGTVVSFPLGQTTIREKVFEAEQAIADGAGDVDYVLNIGKLRMGDLDYIEREMRAIKEVCRQYGAVSKVIFENCYLTREEIRAAAETALKVKPDFIKTSTGFGTGGATEEDVRLMKSVVGDAVKVKAAGGIRDWATCRRMLEAGAERIGTSSGPKILEGFDG